MDTFDEEKKRVWQKKATRKRSIDLDHPINLKHSKEQNDCRLAVRWPSWSKAHGSGPPDPDGTQLSPCLERGVGSNPTLIISFCFFRGQIWSGTRFAWLPFLFEFIGQSGQSYRELAAK